jgi:hypothetical protein
VPGTPLADRFSEFGVTRRVSNTASMQPSAATSARSALMSPTRRQALDEQRIPGRSRSEQTRSTRADRVLSDDPNVDLLVMGGAVNGGVVVYCNAPHQTPPCPRVATHGICSTCHHATARFQMPDAYASSAQGSPA